MKTIEERAKEYADRHQAVEFKYFGLERVYGYNRIYNAEKTAYEKGATEQKAIDDAEWLKIKSSWEREAQINHNDENNYKQGFHDAIENACEWFSNYLMEIGYPDDWMRHSPNMISGKERFRKAMSE